MTILHPGRRYSGRPETRSASLSEAGRSLSGCDQGL